MLSIQSAQKHISGSRASRTSVVALAELVIKL